MRQRRKINSSSWCAQGQSEQAHPRPHTHAPSCPHGQSLRGPWSLPCGLQRAGVRRTRGPGEFQDQLLVPRWMVTQLHFVTLPGQPALCWCGQCCDGATSQEGLQASASERFPEGATWIDPNPHFPHSFLWCREAELLKHPGAPWGRVCSAKSTELFVPQSPVPSTPLPASSAPSPPP